MIAGDGTRFKFEYNEDETIKNIQDSKGKKISYTYDSNKYVSSTTLSYLQESISTSQINDSSGHVTKEVNEYGSEFSKQLDTYKNITKLTNPDGGEFYYTYTKYDDLKTLSSDSYKHTLTYEDVDRQIKEINVQNGSKYTYEYDSFGRLLSVKLNNILLTEFTYKSSSDYNLALIDTKEYFNEDYYRFEYDENNRLKTVMYLDDEIATFEYDDKDNIYKVSDKVNNLTKYYSYENDKLVKIVTTKGDEYNYYYDNLGNIQKTNYLINNKYRSYDYMYNYEQNESTFDFYINKLISDTTADIIVGSNNFKGLFGLEKTISTANSTPSKSSNNYSFYDFDDEIDYVTIDLNTCNKKLENSVNTRTNFDYKNWNNQYYYYKYIAIWFKPTGSYKQTSLIKVDNISNSNPNLYGDFRINSNGYIEYYNKVSGVMLTSSKKVIVDEWNLLELNINEEYTSFSLNGIKTNVVESSLTCGVDILHIGKQDIISDEEESSSSSSSEESLTMPFKVSMILVDNKDANLVYEDGLKALNYDQGISYEGTYYTKSSINNSYEVISFNGSLESNKGMNSLYFEKEKDKSIFKYDEEKSKLCLASFNSNIFGYQNLGYDFNLATSGMISIDFKCNSADSYLNKEIINIYHEYLNESELKIYVYNGFINVSSKDGYVTFYSKRINNDTWYKLTLFYNSSYVSVYIDNTSIGTFSSINTSLFSGSTLYLGGRKNLSKLDGLLSNLVISKTSIDSSNYLTVINTLSNELNIKHIYTYDELNRLKSNKIYTQSTTLNHTYNFNKNRVASENLFGSETLSYTYDVMGNVKTISSSNDLNHNKSYTYDKFGRLKTEYINETDSFRTYTYDSNGNILTVIDENFDLEVVRSLSYHYTNDKLLYIKDELLNTNIFELEYNGHNPISLNNNDITYEGRRIKTFGNNTYFYNEEGIRVKKITSLGNTHEYVLEGNKILSEKIYNTSNNTLLAELNYNYDIKGELVSAEYNDKVYFYIKDILGNIIKIVDKDGADVVKYYYNSFGVVTSNIISVNEDDCTFVQYNPFIYKGYYYDKETNLYYLNSRFYSPELCRFITVDDYSYLDSESLGSINLYCYCKNNPVMMYDPSGRFPWLIILVVVAIGATVNDIYEITRNDGNGVEATASGDNVHIKNSSKIITPWVKLGYSIYLNHFNEETKDVIDGSSFGVLFEWQLHDLAYYGLSFIDIFVDSDTVTGFKDKAQSVDVGKTIYSDDHGAFSWVMWGLYIFSNPISSVVDLFIHF